MDTITKAKGLAFSKLAEVIAALRHPVSGCPWDREQTHTSLKPYLIEESYELHDAIDSGDAQKIKEELGDVLLQVMLHAQIGEDEGTLTLDQVIVTLTDKLVDRHPHVFGEAKAETADEVRQQWEQGKRQKEDRNRVLQGVPRSLPALAKAQLIGEKVRSLNFDWDTPQEILAKVDEELKEFLDEATSNEPGAAERCEEELGDLLFTLAQFARKRGFNAEEVLQRGCKKFTARFDKLEELLDARGRPDLSHHELELLWQEVKA